jgi:hypothetical protein
MSLTYPPFFLFFMGVQARIGKLAARKGLYAAHLPVKSHLKNAQTASGC